MSIRRTLLASLAGAAALAITASAAHAATPDLDAAKTMVEEHSALPTFKAPGDPFDARACMKGKKILTIPVSSANPFTKNIATAMTAVAKQIGFTVTEWENQ